MYILENTSKQQRGIVYQYVAHFGEKNIFLLLFVPFYWFDQKKLFKLIQIFFRICFFSNMVRKTNFLSFSMLFSELVTFLTKKKSSLWISSKILQNNRKA